MKKCSNCSRNPQDEDQFIGRFGKPTNTCLKCREKGKKHDNTEDRKAAHAALAAVKGNEYSQASRARRLEEDPEAYREHNNEILRAWRNKNKEHVSVYFKTNQNARLDAIKRSATERGKNWNLEDEFAKSLLVQPCQFCSHLELGTRLNGIDRIVNSIGYEPSNVVTACKFCNFAKNKNTLEEFFEMCIRVSKRCPNLDSNTGLIKKRVSV